MTCSGVTRRGPLRHLISEEVRELLVNVDLTLIALICAKNGGKKKTCFDSVFMFLIVVVRISLA